MPYTKCQQYRVFARNDLDEKISKAVESHQKDFQNLKRNRIRP